MGRGRRSLQKLREEWEAENMGIVIPTQVQWLESTHTIRKKRQNGEIAASFVVFVEKRNNLAQSWMKKGINVAKVGNQVEVFTNVIYVSS